MSSLFRQIRAARLGRRIFLPLYWVGLSALLLAGDYVTGPYFQFPIFFLIPIILASWYSGRIWGLILAIILSLARPYIFTIWDESWSLPTTAVNAAIRILVFATIAFFVGQAAVKTREVRVLQGILPTCRICQKIRIQDDTWEPLEQYITERSEARFSHGLCPECVQKHFGDC